MRDDAPALIGAALGAVDPVDLVSESLRARPVPGEGPVSVVGFGKAAAGMGGSAAAVLGDRFGGGVLVVPESVEVPGFDVHVGGHPVPDGGGVAGASAIRERVRRLGRGERLLALISGGGSALATLPAAGITLDDLGAVTDLLLRGGAPIEDLNCVRKHLDLLKGGRLARLAAPAPVRALVLSDVLGDLLDVIASGPLSPDPTTFADAVQVLRRFEVWERVPAAVRAHLEAAKDESPKPGDPCFDRVEVEVVGNLRRAAEAAVRAAESRGYRARLESLTVTGEAREVGYALGLRARDLRIRSEPLQPPAVLVAGGETTVTVRGAGRGGRNQEVALGAARALEGLDDVLVVAIGTDGIDGPTDAAGALATGSTLRRARARGLDPARALAENDTYPFFDALGDLIRLGPTGTNVMDLHLILVR